MAFDFPTSGFVGDTRAGTGFFSGGGYQGGNISWAPSGSPIGELPESQRMQLENTLGHSVPAGGSQGAWSSNYNQEEPISAKEQSILDRMEAAAGQRQMPGYDVNAMNNQAREAIEAEYLPAIQAEQRRMALAGFPAGYETEGTRKLRQQMANAIEAAKTRNSTDYSQRQASWQSSEGNREQSALNSLLNAYRRQTTTASGSGSGGGGGSAAQSFSGLTDAFNKTRAQKEQQGGGRVVGGIPMRGSGPMNIDSTSGTNRVLADKGMYNTSGQLYNQLMGGLKTPNVPDMYADSRYQPSQNRYSSISLPSTIADEYPTNWMS